MQQTQEPLSAAPDTKRPISASSSTSDSQTLSRTRQAKHHYSTAARAFLQKDQLTALLESQHAVNILAASSSSNLGLSLSTGNLADAEVELARLTEKLAILRFTVLSSTSTDEAQRKAILSQLSQNTNRILPADSDSQPTSQFQEASKQLSSLLSREPAKFIAHLWFEALRLCSQTHSDVDVPSLEPSAETLLLAVELPSSVVSAAILASLRLDDLHANKTVGTQSARLIAEWYLAAYSSAVGPQGPTDKAAAAYEKVVDLYALHILATRLDEWDYAREFVGYSSLDEHKKLALLGQLDATHIHVLARPDRVLEAEAAARKAYEDEKARRAAAEQEASASGSNGKAHDLVRGIGNFLRGDDASTASTGEASKRRSGSGRRSGAGDASSGSESGSRAGYFSSSRGSSSSSSSSPTSASPDGVSTGSSSRSGQVEGKQGPAAKSNGKGSSTRSRSGERSSSRRTNNINGTEAKEASDAASSSSRSRSRDAASGSSSGGAELKAKEAMEKDDGSYASTRAHLSRYIENGSKSPRSIGPSPSSGRNAAAPAFGNLLATLKSFFDLRNAQSRSYLLSAIVVLFVFYRAVRRRGGGGTASGGASTVGGKGRRQESLVARDARNRLVKGGGAASTYGLGPVLFVWKKVVDTVKMGTQVTYL